MAKRGRSAAALRKLRKKYGLGEFKKRKRKRRSIYTKAYRKKTGRRRPNRSYARTVYPPGFSF